ncbi:MAG: TAXI family TRAP transporter solute-binding subunit [Spirochaetaceae bacterium]|nr:TAXI family TRAP transporter solute-binding subunit [Spirochaetaceae bacterium]
MRKVVVCLMALALITGAQAQNKAGWPDQLKFMSGPPGGNWFALGTALSEMWSKNVIQTTSSSGGGVANILNADAKKGDFGFTVASLLGAAIAGEEDFEGKAVKNSVIMANLYTQYTYFIMRKDFAEKNGIKSVDDMIAKDIPIRFATLKPGTASEFVIKALFKKGYNTNYDQLKKKKWTFEFTSYEGGADLLADNHLDCFAFSVGKVASIVMNIESNTPIVILPIGQKALDAFAAAYGTTTFTIQPGTYKSVTSPVKTIGDYTCIVIRKDLPDSLVYELNKALWANRDSLAMAVKDISELNPKEALPTGLPAHPGSEQFWKSVK